MMTQKNKILFLFAAAAKELKIDPKTIPSALKAGRDSFTRKSDGKKFTIEIPKENTPSQKKPKPPSEEQKRKWAEAKRKIMITDLYRQHSFYPIENTSIEEMIRYLEIRNPEGLKAIQQPSEELLSSQRKTLLRRKETHSEDPSEKRTLLRKRKMKRTAKNLLNPNSVSNSSSAKESSNSSSAKESSFGSCDSSRGACGLSASSEEKSSLGSS